MYRNKSCIITGTSRNEKEHILPSQYSSHINTLTVDETKFPDSGINSIGQENNVGNPVCVWRAQSMFFGKQNVPFTSKENNFARVLKFRPHRCTSRVSEISNDHHFYQFANSLMNGLLLYIEDLERKSESGLCTKDELMEIKSKLMKKHEMINSLMHEYRELADSQVTATPVALSQSRRMIHRSVTAIRSLISLINIPSKVRTESTLGIKRARMREIQQIIGNLSGSFQFHAESIGGSTLYLQDQNYYIQLRIEPFVDADCNINTNAHVQKSLFGKKPVPVMSNAHSWCFTCKLNSLTSVYSSNMFNENIKNMASGLHYVLTDQTHSLSPEPFAALLIGVYTSSGAKLQPCKCAVSSIDEMFKPTIKPIKASLSSTGFTFVNIEVVWHPLTNLDCDLLDINSNFPSVDSRSRNLTGLHDNHSIPSVRSMVSQLTDPPNLSVSLASLSNHSAGRVIHSGYLDHLTPDCDPASVLSDSKIGYKNWDGNLEKESAKSLGELCECLYDNLESICRVPGRYTQIFMDFLDTLSHLLEQLVPKPVLLGNTPIETPKSGSSSTKLSEGNVLQVLDFAYSAETKSPLLEESILSKYSRQHAVALTTGWEQLDQVLIWHLENAICLVSLLDDSVSRDACSESGSHGHQFAQLHHELTALALQEQRDIISDLVNIIYCFEYQEASITLKDAYCFNYLGTRRESSNLLPATFWPLVTGSTVGANDKTLNLMYSREFLLDYTKNEFRDLISGYDNELILCEAFEVLFEHLTDSDITNNDCNEIPLTQLCRRLSRPNLHKPIIRRPSYPKRTTPVASRRPESTFKITLKYLIGQYNLQHELRSNEAAVRMKILEEFRSQLTFSCEKESVSVSVNTVLCMAFSCLSEDLSMKPLASSIFELLSKSINDNEFYSSHATYARLPFLRRATPCFLFAETLNSFSEKLSANGKSANCFDTFENANNRCNYRPGIMHLGPQRSLDDGRKTFLQGTPGQCGLTPMSAVILWSVQCSWAEDYCLAGLAVLADVPQMVISESKNERNEFIKFLYEEIAKLSVAANSQSVREEAKRALVSRRNSVAFSIAKSRSMGDLLDLGNEAPASWGTT